MRFNTGFTAVELLVTLFVASFFLFAGYQLFLQVSRAASDADKSARVSNIVYQKLHEKVDMVVSTYTNGCNSTYPQDTTSISAEGIGGVTLVTTITCPSGASAARNLFLVNVSGSYGSGSSANTISHATYAK